MGVQKRSVRMATIQLNPPNHGIIKLTVLGFNLFLQKPCPNYTDSNQHEQLEFYRNSPSILSFVLPFIADLWAD